MYNFMSGSWVNWTFYFWFKKQPGKKIIASGTKIDTAKSISSTQQDNQKLLQLIQNLFKSNGTITNSTTIQGNFSPENFHVYFLFRH